MTFSNSTHRKFVGILAALVICFAVVGPAAAMYAGLGGSAVTTGTATPEHQLYSDLAGAATTGLIAPTAQEIAEFRSLGVGAVTTGLIAPTAQEIAEFRSQGVGPVLTAQDIPEFHSPGVGAVSAPSEIVRPAPADNVRPTAPIGRFPSHPAQVPVAGPSLDWSDVGVGIAIGALAGLLLGAALLGGRRRSDGTLAPA